MKNLLKLWFQRLANAEAQPTEEREYHLDLLIPVSQLYGIEFHPSVYRYYER